MAAALAIAGALVATTLACAQAAAGDYANLEILGFSPEGRTFAFEEYGVQDGSGFPYSNIYVIDTATDGWVSGTPVRVLTEDKSVALEKTRSQAQDEARPILTARKVGAPGNHVASNPPTELSADPHRVVFLPRFISPLGGDAYELALTETNLPAEGCPDMNQPFRGFRLTLKTANGVTQTLANDTAIPSSRRCPTGYAISDVLTYYPDAAAPVLVVILSMYRVGFEGPDRRFLAVTATLPQ